MLAYTEREREGKPPHWLPDSAVAGLAPIAVLPSKPDPAATGTGTYALLGEGGGNFTLYRPGMGPTTHYLPSYRESSAALLRVALTPLAVSGDVVMVGCVAGIVAVVGLAEGGYSSR